MKSEEKARPSGRKADELRRVTITRNFTRHAEGSVLVEFGDTKVLCTASVETGVPGFLRGLGQGWLTAEYGMLPRSSHTRTAREPAKGKQKEVAATDEGFALAEPVATEQPVNTRKEVAQRPAAPVLDWGGTVWLSNDDSMSLASAQRLIYAVKNGIGYSVPQIRPHELLNYFSFDTVTPDADQTFDVLASATQDGDQLTLALAVTGAMLAFAALLPWAGLVPASIAVVVIGSLGNRDFRLVEAIVSALLLSAFAALLFVRGIGLTIEMF